MHIQPIAQEQAWQLRHEVMWPDKELDYVKLQDDHEGSHYGLFVDKQLISVLSLFIYEDVAQFRKFATLSSRQGQGYGSRLLQYVLEAAQQAGVKRIYCNARVEKAPFYEKFGLIRTQDSFERGGKAYVIMERWFTSTGSA